MSKITKKEKDLLTEAYFKYNRFPNLWDEFIMKNFNVDHPFLMGKKLRMCYRTMHQHYNGVYCSDELTLYISGYL
jgi:hypothetical protein